MKKIAMSLMTISAVVVFVVGATSAYFSDTAVVTGNTFASGKVTIGDVSLMRVNVSGLIPGVPQEKKASLYYAGTIDADLWLGNRGTDSSDFYFADELNVKIEDWDDSSKVWFNGYASGLATDWRKIANDIPAGWRSYRVTFTLDFDAPNTYQNESNETTEFLLYAVQWNGPKPNQTPPYLTTGEVFDIPTQ